MPKEKENKNYKLLQMLDQKGINRGELAEALGVGYNTMLNKISGKTSFTIDEIKAIMKRCDLTFADIEEIFF